jgi:hypothetical protein
MYASQQLSYFFILCFQSQELITYFHDIITYFHDRLHTPTTWITYFHDMDYILSRHFFVHNFNVRKTYGPYVLLCTFL